MRPSQRQCSPWLSDHERFLNLHGERGVRLDSKQSIHYCSQRRKKWVDNAEAISTSNESQRWCRRLLSAFFSKQPTDETGDERVQVDAGDPEPSPMAKQMHRSSPLMNALTLFMFGGPYVHANRLRDMTLDQIVNKNLLGKYTEKMVAEWRDVALYVGQSCESAQTHLTQLHCVGNSAPRRQRVVPNHPERRRGIKGSTLQNSSSKGELFFHTSKLGYDRSQSGLADSSPAPRSHGRGYTIPALLYRHHSPFVI